MRRSPFLILSAAGLFAIFSSTISKSPALPLFAQHLGADPGHVGLIASISAFTGILASIPAGMLSDRFGRKRMLLFSSFVFASAPFLYLMVERLWQLALVRFYHGFATAVFIPVAMALVSDLYRKDRGEKIGWFSSATLLGRFMAPAVGGFLLGAFSLSPTVGFHAVYLLCGAAGVSALFCVFRLPDPSPEHAPGRTWKETFEGLSIALAHRGILMTAAVEAGILFAYGAFETFLPLYAHAGGLSAYEIGALLSAQVITIGLTKPLMGRFSDRHGRQPQIVAGGFIGAVSIAFTGFAAGFLPLLAISILFGLGLSIVTSATSAFIADLSRRESLGSSMGILGSVMDIGHTAGPIVAGVVAGSFGFAAGFFAATLVLAGTTVLFRVYAPARTAAE